MDKVLAASNGSQSFSLGLPEASSLYSQAGLNTDHTLKVEQFAWLNLLRICKSILCFILPRKGF